MTTLGKGRVGQLSDEAMQVFDGCMLGDAGVHYHSTNGVRGRKWENQNPVFQIDQSGIKHVDWLEDVRTYLLRLGLPMNSVFIGKSISHGKPYTYCRLNSKTHPLLRTQRDRWYLSKTKIVPRDVRITSLSLAHWFMGDGSAEKLNRGQDQRYRQSSLGPTVVVTLHTNKFTDDEVDLLRFKLSDIGIYTTKHYMRSDEPQINIRQGSVDRFMSVIQPFVCDSFFYKIRCKGVFSYGN